MKKEIVLGITGSIAAYKACDIISALRKEGFSLTCVMTKEAHEFVTLLSVQTLSQNEVHTDMFKPPAQWNPLHTSLAERADLILIAPATANVIGKLASGVCDDLLSSVVFSAKVPVLIVPAMNERMYAHRIIAENVKKLKAIGYKFVGPVKGHLACGHVGVGHIAPVEDIVRAVKKLLVS